MSGFDIVPGVSGNCDVFTVSHSLEFVPFASTDHQTVTVSGMLPQLAGRTVAILAGYLYLADNSTFTGSMAFTYSDGNMIYQTNGGDLVDQPQYGDSWTPLSSLQAQTGNYPPFFPRFRPAEELSFDIVKTGDTSGDAAGVTGHLLLVILAQR